MGDAQNSIGCEVLAANIGIGVRAALALPLCSIEQGDVTAPNRQRGWRARPTERRAWIAAERRKLLGQLAHCAATITWNRDLFLALLRELDTDDDFMTLCGDPERIPRRRHAAALATVLLIRHSWRPDDLASIAAKLGLQSAPPHQRRLRAGRVSARINR